LAVSYVYSTDLQRELMTALAVSTMSAVFILLPLLVIWVMCLVDIVRRDLPFQAKAAWSCIVLLLPFVGALAYLLTRKPTKEEVRLHRAARAAKGGGATGRGIGPHPPID
jgi:hypothetical protein